MNYYQLIESSLNYIEANIKQPLDLSIVAESFNMSKYYYHRLFSAFMGDTFNNYLRMRKLNHALQLMEDSSLSLTAIAYEVGFSDQSAFSRAFKSLYGQSPKQMLKQNKPLPIQAIPKLVNRSFKNLNGDITTSFELLDFVPKQIKGVVFQVDIAKVDFKDQIRNRAEALLGNLNIPFDTKGYMVYSNCEPNSTKFNALFGIELDFESNLEHVFTIELPEVFCAKFNYAGDLLDIGDIVASDFARFLRISRLEADEHDVELIQEFPSVHHLDQAYDVYVPIKKLDIDQLY